MDEDPWVGRTSPEWDALPESTRRDIRAYERFTPTEDERALGHMLVRLDLGDDDVDDEARFASLPSA